MTDGIKRYGSNGSADGTTPVICKEEAAKVGQGGRLKFFKGTAVFMLFFVGVLLLLFLFDRWQVYFGIGALV